jgi:hypothetical protein
MTRLWLTVLVVAVICAIFLLMRAGWRHRVERQHDIPALPIAPEPPAHVSWTSATYVGATRAGEWLDRIVVSTLGVADEALVAVAQNGVWVRRAHNPDIYLERRRVRGVRYDNAIAGKVLEPGGMLVITWDHGGTLLDIGLRVHDPYSAQSLRQLLQGVAS